MRHEREESARLALGVKQRPQRRVATVELGEANPRQRAQHDDRQQQRVATAKRTARRQLARHGRESDDRVGRQTRIETGSGRMA